MHRRQELRGTSRLRAIGPPPGLTLLLRGGPQETLDLCLATEDCAARYTLDGAPFHALSLTAVLDGERAAAALGVAPLVKYQLVHRMTSARLVQAGFPVWATFTNPRHFSVQLADSTRAAMEAFLVVAGPLQENPHYDERRR